IPRVSKLDETVEIRIPLATGLYVRRVKKHSDRIIVTLEQCEKCKEPGVISIPNPNDLPIYFSDETVTKQVYPVNEFTNDVERSQ
ncbi:MAG TPA: hypothetical protein VMM56_02630, partial [Planctomycetaceae bacterium]|nr:hypothetical protein [Planctomycetaceae bacterium]